MKAVILSLCVLAATEAGIVSPLFFSNPGNHFIYPFQLRKIISYTPKPVYSGYATQLYTFPLVEHTVPATTPLFLVPTVRAVPSSTVVAKAKAASSAGVADSSVVAHSDESVPFSVVANSSPGAAYSSAVLHPAPSGIPFAAGAQASVTGGH